ncbi:unnamed protein product [Tenebrio molitor]|nr:unnamed protein product [Tenebrio molitor]
MLNPNLIYYLLVLIHNGHKLDIRHNYMPKFTNYS